MTESEKKEIIKEVFTVLNQYGKTIAQLTSITEIAADDLIEVSGGRSIRIGDLLKNVSTIEELKKLFLSKTGPEQTEHLLKLLGGLAFNDGYGITSDGIAKLKGIEADYLRVIEIVNEKLSHVGGQIVLSPARMKCTRVEELSDSYRCYFDRGKVNESGRYETDQQFVAGDQARHQVFTGIKQKYYWRLVTLIGEDYIELSKTDCDTNSDIPMEGDDICQLGNRTDPTRQNAQILSSYGSDAPSFKQYSGIDSYSLSDKVDTRLQPGDNELSGVLHLKNGSTGAGNLHDLPEEIQKATDLGSVNLLRNSGFTGQFTNEELSADTVLTPESELYNKKLANWTGIATVGESAHAVSGYAVTLGSLSQSIKLIVGENYVVSYKASGASVAVSCGNFNMAQALTATPSKYVHKFKFTGNQLFLVSGTAILCDLKLERGTIATDWTPSPLDNDKSMAEMQALSYMQSAIKEGSVDLIGGLALMNMLQLGNYQDGKMQQVTAGISGIYNDEDDVAYWAGGTFEQAIRTVMFYKDHPTATPTEAELKLMAKYAVTHGGRAILNDVILRGYIYALGGIFQGTVSVAGGKTLLKEDGTGHLADKAIYWDELGYLYQKSRPRICWRFLAKEMSDAGMDHLIPAAYDIDLRKGTYLETLTNFDDVRHINLPNPADVPGAILDISCSIGTRSSGSLKIKCSSSYFVRFKNGVEEQYDSAFLLFGTQGVITSIANGGIPYWFIDDNFNQEI